MALQSDSVCRLVNRPALATSGSHTHPFKELHKCDRVRNSEESITNQNHSPTHDHHDVQMPTCSCQSCTDSYIRCLHWHMEVMSEDFFAHLLMRKSRNALAVTAFDLVFLRFRKADRLHAPRLKSREW